MNWDKIEQAIHKAIEDRDARSPELRARVYAAARAALDRRHDIDRNALAQFDALAGKIESVYAPEPMAAPARPSFFGKKWRLTRQWLPFVVGILVGSGAVLFVDAMTVNSMGADKMAVIRSNYEATQAQVPIAIDFLQEVADAVIKAQGDGRKKLEATKSFAKLAKFDPDLAEKIPRSLPKGSAVILKADPFNFKILFNWPLCGTVSLSNPNMVDPVRSSPKTIGCPYFGLWTTGASDW